jgi:hypothetical protein
VLKVANKIFSSQTKIFLLYEFIFWCFVNGNLKYTNTTTKSTPQKKKKRNEKIREGGRYTNRGIVGQVKSVRVLHIGKIVG